MLEAEVHTVPMASPDDISQVRALFDEGVVDPNHVVGIIAQTEGDGFARGYSAQSLQILFSELLNLSHQEIFDRIPMMMIGGTAGLMCPHFTLFVIKPASNGNQSDDKRLVIGVESTRALLPEEYGRMAQLKEVEAAVRSAMKSANITDPADVRNVELKVPQLTPARLKDATDRGKTVVSTNFPATAGLSRGASALGAALALGEVKELDLDDKVIAGGADVYSERTSASSGNEQVGCRAIVIGNVAGSSSRYVAGNGVMNHQLDLEGARAAFEMAGLRVENGCLVPEDRDRIAAVFVNAGANYAPDVLGRRHTMLSDFLAAYAGHQAKAVVHAILSGIVGNTMVLANAGAEHQGKPGANLVCVIARA